MGRHFSLVVVIIISLIWLIIQYVTLVMLYHACIISAVMRLSSLVKVKVRLVQLTKRA